MGNRTIVAVTLLFTAALSALVFTASYDIEDNTPIKPPSMMLEVDGTLVEGLEASYCWREENTVEPVCVEKVNPGRLSTRLAIIAEEVSPNATYRFFPANHSEPDSLSVEFRTNEGEDVRTYEPSDGTVRPDISPGVYTILTQASWENEGNVTHVFQVEIEDSTT